MQNQYLLSVNSRIMSQSFQPVNGVFAVSLYCVRAVDLFVFLYGFHFPVLYPYGVQGVFSGLGVDAYVAVAVRVDHVSGGGVADYLAV